MCKRDLVGGRLGAESNLSEMAHIRGVAGGSARHDPSMSHDDVNKHRNLILLCGTCHKTVDDDPDEYTPNRLERVKLDHERWARQKVVRDSRATSFEEIDAVAKYIVKPPSAVASMDYTVTPPMEKIKKNRLSNTAQSWIEIGMSKSHLVGKYLAARSDPSFAERLKDGFLAIYRNYRESEDLDADGAFFSMLAMGGDVPGKGERTMAVLAVTVYLFEKCEVFEK